MHRSLYLIAPALLFTMVGCKEQATEPEKKPKLVTIPERKRLNVPDTIGIVGSDGTPRSAKRTNGFVDVTKKSGITFRHVNGSFGQKLLPETMGAGVAFFDYDNDGDADLLFVNSRYWPGHEKGDAPTLELYRNDGGFRFTNVTKGSGLDVTLYGMGVTCGDYDNDGFVDVFVTGVGGNRLFRNLKGASFQDVTAAARVGGPSEWERAAKGDFLKHGDPITFSTSATFLDYDGDADLDLFVCNYVTWSPAIDLAQKFSLSGSDRAFGPPKAFLGSVCFLYRNDGAQFADVSASSGVQVIEKVGVGVNGEERRVGKSLGIVSFDADEDGYPEVVVANDTVRNFFFHNVAGPNGTRVFRERGKDAQVAFAKGSARGAMGIDWGEYRPGEEALLIANFADEPCTFLKLHDRAGLKFRDVALAAGLEGPSKPPLKFGAFFFDYDLDGRLDLLIANGHLEPDIAKTQQGQSYRQAAQLFWNTGDARRDYEEITAGTGEVGTDLFKPIVGRGSAYADVDLDGAPDVVLTANGGAPLLLRNDNNARHHWIRLQLKGDGKRSNRDAIGARVVLTVGGKRLVRHVKAGRGYLSQCELPINVGLGEAKKADRVEVYWPGPANKKPTVLTDLAADKTHVIVQGSE